MVHNIFEYFPGGWSNSVPVMSATQLSWTTTDDIGHVVQCHGWVNYVFQDAKGNRHNLDLTVYNDPAGTGPCSYNTSDWPYGFDWLVVTTGGEGPILATTTDQGGQTGAGNLVVTDGDGTVIGSGAAGAGRMAASVTDRNGNLVKINGPVYPSNAFSYVDTAGRTVLQDTGFGISPESVTISGLGLHTHFLGRLSLSRVFLLRSPYCRATAPRRPTVARGRTKGFPL